MSQYNDNLGPLFGQPVPVHADPEPTEVQAQQKVEKVITGWRKQVFEVVQHAGLYGVTGAEVCEIFPERTQSSVRTRLTELRKAGLVKKAGTRENARGNNETVWVAT